MQAVTRAPILQSLKRAGFGGSFILVPALKAAMILSGSAVQVKVSGRR
jgi:hypothetical protein